MTPDLLKQGAQRIAQSAQQRVESTESGGRAAGYGRVLQDAKEVDVTHGRILYLEDVSVSFDGFKALDMGSSAAQSVVLMVIVVSLTVLQFKFVEKKVQY